MRSQIQTAIDEKRRALIAAAVPSDVDEIEELSDFEILREHVESLGEVPLIFCLTTSGMACGPVSESVYVGLDLSAAFVAVKAEAASAVHAGTGRNTGVGWRRSSPRQMRMIDPAHEGSLPVDANAE